MADAPVTEVNEGVNVDEAERQVETETIQAPEPVTVSATADSNRGGHFGYPILNPVATDATPAEEVVVETLAPVVDSHTEEEPVVEPSAPAEAPVEELGSPTVVPVALVEEVIPPVAAAVVAEEELEEPEQQPEESAVVQAPGICRSSRRKLTRGTCCKY